LLFDITKEAGDFTPRVVGWVKCFSPFGWIFFKGKADLLGDFDLIVLFCPRVNLLFVVKVSSEQIQCTAFQKNMKLRIKTLRSGFWETLYDDSGLINQIILPFY